MDVIADNMISNVVVYMNVEKQEKKICENIVKIGSLGNTLRYVVITRGAPSYASNVPI
jgi:hypothetical protein